jgi:hypothetical protein
MLCVLCDFRCNHWKGLAQMRVHYKSEHPEVKRPDKFYTREARNK